MRAGGWGGTDSSCALAGAVSWVFVESIEVKTGASEPGTMMGASKVVTGGEDGGDGVWGREQDLSLARRGGGMVSQTYAEDLPASEGADMAGEEEGWGESEEEMKKERRPERRATREVETASPAIPHTQAPIDCSRVSRSRHRATLGPDCSVPSSISLPVQVRFLSNPQSRHIPASSPTPCQNPTIVRHSLHR